MRTAELNFDISLRKNRCQLCDCIDFSAHVQHSNFSASSQAGRVGLFKVNDNLREFPFRFRFYVMAISRSCVFVVSLVISNVRQISKSIAQEETRLKRCLIFNFTKIYPFLLWSVSYCKNKIKKQLNSFMFLLGSC